MQIKNILSLVLFIVFFGSYLLKLFWLYKQHRIKANVLAKGNKGAGIREAERFVKLATLAWGAGWMFFSVFEKNLISVLGAWFGTPISNGTGLTLLTLGLCIFIVSMLTMKASWRVGIDKDTKTSLVSRGIYKYSRNPAFAGFDLMFCGFFVTYPNALTLVIAVLCLTAIHLLILQEEKHLVAAFGEDYTAYKTNTPRYFLFL